MGRARRVLRWAPHSRAFGSARPEFVRRSRLLRFGCVSVAGAFFTGMVAFEKNKTLHAKRQTPRFAVCYFAPLDSKICRLCVLFRRTL